jgi:hypothetical protein
MCQSHDCRDVLLELKKVNPKFKATLFAIPGEMTPEMLIWCWQNTSWIELAVHGFYHASNYECEKLSYRQFDELMKHTTLTRTLDFYVKGFKAPGWQISDDCYRWLHDNGWWVADKSYNNERRPKELKAYVNYDGNDMRVHYKEKASELLPATHHHCWNCVGNGVYEQFDYLVDLVKEVDEFKFVSEAIDENT